MRKWNTSSPSAFWLIVEVIMQHQRQIKETERISFRQPSGRSVLTEDLKASAKKFRAEAGFADWIARSATDSEKCKEYERLAAHFRQLADAIVDGPNAGHGPFQKQPAKVRAGFPTA
jgi:hypothetical protein